MAFCKHFQRDLQPGAIPHNTESLIAVENHATGMTAFLTAHAGGSYENGLYRIYPTSQMSRWTEVVVEAFPEFRERICCFAFDWLGRVFALDFARRTDDQYLVLMLEPGTGQALEIPTTFMQFHEQELVGYRNEALAAEFFQAWRASGGNTPAFEQCVGYKKPLFLGGSDTIENLEVIDMDVYWSVFEQLPSKVRDLPECTRLGNIQVNE